MPSCSPERRSSRVITGGRRIGALVMVVAFAAAALAGPADASKISDTRAQVRAIEQQLNAMDIKLEASIQAYDGAQQHLTDVRAPDRAEHDQAAGRQAQPEGVAGAAGRVHGQRVQGHRRQRRPRRLRARLRVVQRPGHARRGRPADRRIGACAAEAGDHGRARDLDPPGAAEERGARRRQAGRPEASSRRPPSRPGCSSAASFCPAPRASSATCSTSARCTSSRRPQRPPPRWPSSNSSSRSSRPRRPRTAAAAAGSSGGGGTYNPPPAGTLGQQAAAIAQQYLGVPVRVGRRQPLRLRLLGPRGLRLRAAGRVAAPLHRLALELGRARRRATSWHPATSSSSTASTTSASTWAAGCSSTPRTPARGADLEPEQLLVFVRL